MRTMAMQQNGTLQLIWPRLSAEVSSARRRRKAARRSLAAARIVAATAVAGGAALFATRFGEAGRHECGGSCRPWHTDNVLPASGLSREYPVVRDRRVYAIEKSAQRVVLTCHEKQTGRILWRSELETDRCRMDSDGDRVYLLSVDAETPWTCRAFDAVSGALVWSRTSEDGAAGEPSMPAIAGDLVSWTRGGVVIGVDRSTGREMWRADTGERVLSPPVEHDGRLAVASPSTLYAFDMSGTSLWKLPLEGLGSALTPHSANLADSPAGILVVLKSAASSRLALVNTDKLRMEWTRAVDAATSVHPAGSAVVLRGNSLSALDPSTGRELWRLPVRGCGQPALRDGRVYVVDSASKRRLLAVDGRTGHELWHVPVSPSCSGVVIGGRMGFVSGNDGHLQAVLISDDAGRPT
jgi:outer membrane protein assembly factor BamB